MGARRIRREQRQHDQRQSRKVNGMVKTKERARRQDRMVELLKKGEFPYTPTLQSWLSETLNKPASRITQADVEELLKKS